MLGSVEIPAKAGASALFEGGVKALPFLKGFTTYEITSYCVDKLSK